MFARSAAVLVTALLVLASCASDVMESYIGKSISEPMMDYGRPADVFDLGNNRRAFQWIITTSGAMPMTSPSYGTIYGNGGWASVTTRSTTYVPYSQTCAYTLTAIKSGDDWIVDGFRKPTFGCE
jgi:hypothetical protein